MGTKNFDPKSLLEKHGWKSGSGLGKNEGGIKEAIKVELKMDKAGMGYDASEKFCYQWWDHVYNTAAKSIEVVADENGVSIKRKSPVAITTTKKSKGALKKPLAYGNFVKTATLTNGGQEVKDLPDESDGSVASDNGIISKMTDEELFAACGGMTGHKGARHGINMKAKLLRIQQHDEQFLSTDKAQQNFETDKIIKRNLEETENKNGKLSPGKQHMVPSNDKALGRTKETQNDAIRGTNGEGVAKRKKKQKRCEDDSDIFLKDTGDNIIDKLLGDEELKEKKRKKARKNVKNEESTKNFSDGINSEDTSVTRDRKKQKEKEADSEEQMKFKDNITNSLNFSDAEPKTRKLKKNKHQGKHQSKNLFHEEISAIKTEPIAEMFKRAKQAKKNKQDERKNWH